MEMFAPILAGILVLMFFGVALAAPESFDLGGYQMTVDTSVSYRVGEQSSVSSGGADIYTRSMGPEVILNGKMLGPAVKFAVFKYKEDTAFDFLKQVTKELGWGSYGWKGFAMRMDRIGGKMAFIGNSTVAGSESMDIGAASFPLDKQSRDFAVIIVYDNSTLFSEVLKMKIE